MLLPSPRLWKTSSWSFNVSILRYSECFGSSDGTIWHQAFQVHWVSQHSRHFHLSFCRKERRKRRKVSKSAPREPTAAESGATQTMSSDVNFHRMKKTWLHKILPDWESLSWSGHNLEMAWNQPLNSCYVILVDIRCGFLMFSGMTRHEHLTSFCQFHSAQIGAGLCRHSVGTGTEPNRWEAQQSNLCRYL